MWRCETKASISQEYFCTKAHTFRIDPRVLMTRTTSRAVRNIQHRHATNPTRYSTALCSGASSADVNRKTTIDPKPPRNITAALFSSPHYPTKSQPVEERQRCQQNEKTPLPRYFRPKIKEEKCSNCRITTVKVSWLGRWTYQIGHQPNMVFDKDPVENRINIGAVTGMMAMTSLFHFVHRSSERIMGGTVSRRRYRRGVCGIVTRRRKAFILERTTLLE